MHVDNRGPQTADEVVEGIEAVRRTFPKAEIVPSTMDAWTAELLQAKASLTEIALPTLVDVEPGSTWAYGVSAAAPFASSFEASKKRLHRSRATLRRCATTAPSLALRPSGSGWAR